MYRGCVYVPKDPQLHHDIVHAHHDCVMTSHPGWWKTLELVSRNYWCPGISHYVASYMAGCDACNCCKSFPMQKVGKLTPNWIPTRHWEVISVDTIRGLPESKGYNTILVVVDSLSKHIHAMPTVTTVDSTGVACLFLEHVWRHHRLLEAIISDRGSAFISNFSRELAALLDIQLTPSTAYHLQTDGQTEQVNQEIKAYLRVFVSHCQDDWADWVPLARFAYNNQVHSATCHTPFELDSGQHPQMGLEPTWSSAVEATDDFAQRMSQMQDEVKATLKHAVDEMAWYYDCQRSPTPIYKVGAKVWLNAQNYMTTHPTKKLDHKWLGPFVIEKVVSPAAIKLHLSPCKRGIHPVISVSNVHPYHPDPIPECLLDLHPNLVLVDGSEEYEVESIVDSKYRYQHLHYLVKFKGWPDSNNEWLPADHLANAPDIMQDFHLHCPSAPTPCHMSHL